MITSKGEPIFAHVNMHGFRCKFMAPSSSRPRNSVMKIAERSSLKILPSPNTITQRIIQIRLICFLQLVGEGTFYCLDNSDSYRILLQYTLYGLGHCSTSLSIMAANTAANDGDYLGPLSNLSYKAHQIPKLKCFLSCLAVVFAQSIEARC